MDNKTQTNRNSGLKCSVENGELVIRCGVDTLKIAAEHSLDIYGEEVSDADMLARDIAAQLQKENEIGTCILTDMLDKATQLAFISGSEAFKK